MSGLTTSNISYLTRAQLYSSEIKELLLDQLFAQQWVKWMTDFPDGDVINIPMVGQMEAMDYAENQAVKYQAIDTGNWDFTITEYKQAGTYVTKKLKQDAWLMSQVEPTLVPRMQRALAKQMELDVLSQGPRGQTADSLNTINGANHRFVASGTNKVITLEDFAKVMYALQMANVPDTNVIGIVHPSVAYHLATQTNVVNLLSPVPQWTGLVENGFTQGMKFVRNVYGIDIYTSQNLYVNTAAEATLGAVAGDVNNIFFSVTPDVMPLVGAIRQAPQVDTDYNMQRQRDEYVVTCRYGFGFQRPENFVTVLTSTGQVYA